MYAAYDQPIEKVLDLKKGVMEFFGAKLSPAHQNTLDLQIYSISNLVTVFREIAEPWA